MAESVEKDLKLYYSIKEVSEMFGVAESTLRFWETEFSFLRPKTKGTSKVRQYARRDIDQIRLIHNLVKVRGFKISAARRILARSRNGAQKSAEVITCLTSVRDDLLALKRQMDLLA